MFIGVQLIGRIRTQRKILVLVLVVVSLPAKLGSPDNKTICCKYKSTCPCPPPDPCPCPSGTCPCPSDTCPCPSDTCPCPSGTCPCPSDTCPCPSNTCPQCSPSDTSPWTPTTPSSTTDPPTISAERSTTKEVTEKTSPSSTSFTTPTPTKPATSPSKETNTSLNATTTTSATGGTQKNSTQWKLRFKIKENYSNELSDVNSTEHLEMTKKLWGPIEESCRNVLGSFFIRVNSPLLFEKGSVLVTATIDLFDGNPNVTNAALWEKSLSSTLLGLFIENSTLINDLLNVTVTTPTTSRTPQNEAIIIGVACGTIAAVTVLIVVFVVVVVRHRGKKNNSSNNNSQTGERAERPGKDGVGGRSQLPLPGNHRSMTWRESSGTISLGASSKSNLNKEIRSRSSASHEESADGGDDHDGVAYYTLLHRGGAANIDFDNDIYDDKNLRQLSNQRPSRPRQGISGGLPRILVIPQEECGTVTTSSTDKSVKVVLSNHGTRSTSQMLHGPSTNAAPADFGGLFVPEGSSEVGRAVSLGSKLNRLNSSWRGDAADIDLGSLSNAGDLYSLKPSHSDDSSKEVTNVPQTGRKFFLSSSSSKDNDAKLHREFMERMTPTHRY